MLVFAKAARRYVVLELMELIVLTVWIQMQPTYPAISAVVEMKVSMTL